MSTANDRYWHVIEDDLEAQDVFGEEIWAYEEIKLLIAVLACYAEFERRYGA